MSYRPIHGVHAIDQAVVGVRVFESVSELQFKEIVQQAGVLATGHQLLGRLQLDPMSVAFGRQVISHGMVSEGALHPGMLFQRVNSDGTMAEEMTLERTAVTYRTRSYKRWSDIEKILTDILLPLAMSLANDNLNQVSVVELRCIDRFLSEPSERPALNTLVRKECPYIPKDILDQTSQLHLYTGWFENQSDSSRLLVNMNFDVVDQDDGGRAASILQSLSQQFAKNSQDTRLSVEFLATILDKFRDLHKINKRMLASIINHDMQECINLTGSSGL